MNKPRKVCSLGIHSQVALLHQRHINRGFLSLLDESFLSLLYWAIDSDEESVLLVEEREGRVIGFVAGTNSLGSIYRRMLGRPFKLLFSLGLSLFSYSRIKSILEVLRYSWARPQKSSPVMPRSELLSIVVEPAYRGKGIAEALYERLKDFFCSSDVSGFKIAVGSDLLSAHRFYCRMGAKPLLEIQVHDGETSILYLQSLRSNEEIEQGEVQDLDLNSEELA